MEHRLFSEGFFSSKPHVDPDIAAFHQKHKELEDIAHRLHASGHHITVDYDGEHVVGKGKRSGTLFFNQALLAPRKIQISKTFPLRPFK